jgi:hypothetical protein
MVTSLDIEKSEFDPEVLLSSFGPRYKTVAI